MNAKTESGADVLAYRVMVKGREGADLCIGTVCRATSYASGERVDGWRFMPQTQAAPSRKVWPTASAALKGRVNAYTLVPK